MKGVRIAVFLGVVLSIYGLVNFYIFVRGAGALPPHSPLFTWYVILFLVLALSFIVGRFLERVYLSLLSDVLVWIGSFWLAAMLYFFLAIVLIDAVRLANALFPFFPETIAHAGASVAAATATLVLLVLAGGHINAVNPRTKRLDLSIAKKVEGMRSLKIVAASDIHLGTIIGRRRLRSIVEKINALNPDLILLPGDIVDEDLEPVIKENLGETLRDLRARYGVFAVTGNHEYFGGADLACSYLGEHGVTMLRDAVVLVGDSIFLAGREDASRGSVAGLVRKPLAEILLGVDRARPVLLMDHQPFRLEEAEKNGIDLQLSGHTHHGQLWPFNFITKKVYEVSWGYKRKGATHVYVSSGVGTWGPPVRTGNRPEIVSIVLRFGEGEGKTQQSSPRE